MARIMSLCRASVCTSLGDTVLVNRQWDYCTKEEYTRKVSLERPLMGHLVLVKGQWDHRDACCNIIVCRRLGTQGSQRHF